MSGFLVDPKFDAFMAKLADEEAFFPLSTGHNDMKRLEFMDTHYAACSSGPCEQGRKLCPSPEACRVPERDQMPPVWLAVVIVFLVVCIAAALAALLP